MERRQKVELTEEEKKNWERQLKWRRNSQKGYLKGIGKGEKK